MGKCSEWLMVNGEWGMGNGKSSEWKMGNGEWGKAVNRK
jgi:hypothetical protein